MKAFAVIPAAGRSQRMGRPKLLLPWGGATVIEQVLGAWRASRVERVVVVVHPLDAQIAELAASAGAEVLQPQTAPGEMKDSVRIALEHLSQFGPSPSDAWLMAPADMPALKAETIDALVDAYERSLDAGAPLPRVWVPRNGGRRGHPVLFPWSLAGEVARLGDDEGLNALVARHEVSYIEVGADAIPDDMDTPDDYLRMRGQ